MEFWNDVATDKSWDVLINLKKETDFILIGGWACYLLTGSIKSKDIDIIIDFGALEGLRHKHRIKKTHFLKKYETLIQGISVDIYVGSKETAVMKDTVDYLSKNINSSLFIVKGCRHHDILQDT